MSSLKILYLEAQEADAESIGSIVNIVREVQSGRTVTSVERLAAPLQLAAPADEPAPPLALPKAKRVYKPRPPKATASSDTGERKRAGNAGGTILAALRKSSRPDLGKLALAIYGDASKVAKVKQVLGYMGAKGKIKNNGDGTYTVLG